VTQCGVPVFRPGDRVRITHALHRGQTGKIKRYLPATENYLVAIRRAAGYGVALCGLSGGGLND